LCDSSDEPILFVALGDHPQTLVRRYIYVFAAVQLVAVHGIACPCDVSIARRRIGQN
jgi:hypothetical protein